MIHAPRAKSNSPLNSVLAPCDPPPSLWALFIPPVGLSYARATGMSESLVVYWGVSLICLGLQSPFWPIPVPPTETAPRPKRRFSLSTVIISWVWSLQSSPPEFKLSLVHRRTRQIKKNDPGLFERVSRLIKPAHSRPSCFNQNRGICRWFSQGNHHRS